MGAADGPGFGWRDMDVFMLGVQWKGSTPGLMMGRKAKLRMEQHELVLGLSYHG